MNRQLHSASIAMMIGLLAFGTLALAGCSRSESDKPAPTAPPQAMRGKSPDDQIKAHMQQMQPGNGGQ